MNTNQDTSIVRRAFTKLVPVQFISIVVTSVNGIIDSVIVARYVGATGMAAVGLFGPMTCVIGLMNIFVMGAQIKGCEYMGRGEKKKVESLFSTVTVFFILLGLLVGILMTALASPLAVLLGSSETTHELLVAYIRGYSLGIPATLLMGLLMCFLQINDRSKLSYISMATMMIVNVGMDLAAAYVFDSGLFGLGLATSLSVTVSALIMLVDFFIGKDKKAVSFRWGNFVFNDLGRVAVLGLPSAMFTLGVTIKGYVLNRMLIVTGGDNGLAVMNAENSLITFLSAIPQAIANSVLLMSGIYFGQEDVTSIKKLFRVSMKIGVIMGVALMGLSIALKYPLSLIFFSTTEPAFELCERMILLFPAFLPLNVIFNIFIKIYQSERRNVYVNVFAVGENLLIALVSVILGFSIGLDGIWLCLPVGELIAILIVAVSVFISAGKITFDINDWLRFDKDLGISSENELSMSLSSTAEVETTADRINDFCKSKGTDSRTDYHIQLCVEEFVGNIAERGLGENDHIDVNMIYKDGKYVVRIWDTCKLFDPKSQLDQFDTEHAYENIGIKMVAKLADNMVYMPQFGFNILMITL